MQIEQVPIDKIRIPEVRISNVMPPELAEQFRLSIQTVGALQPIHVLREGETYYLVDGLHRLQELQAKGESTASAVVTEGTLRDALVNNFSVSVLQGRPKPSQARQVVKALEEEYGMDLTAIRRATGATEDYLSKLMWVNRAVPEVQNALDEEEIPLGAAVAIARVADPVKQRRLFSSYLQYHPPVPVFEKIAREIAEEPTDGAGDEPGRPEMAILRPQSDPLCDSCARPTAARHLRPVMLCPGCFGIVYEQLTAAAAAAGASSPNELALKG